MKRNHPPADGHASSRSWGPHLALLLSAITALTVPVATRAGEAEAFDFLDEVMDEYVGAFHVFIDLGAAGNHFPARCAMVPDPNDPAQLAAVDFDETWSEGCHTTEAGTDTCIRSTFDAYDDTFWGGFYFMNGTLQGEEVLPSCNWGEVPDAGFDLGGATTLSFWARGETGEESIEFFVGGVGWPDAPYRESYPRVPSAGTLFDLSDQWQEFTIDLTGQDLSYALSGFGWVASAAENENGAVFYVDDIAFDLPRPDEPRLLRSFRTIPGPPTEEFDTILQNVAWSYDNAVVLLAYLSRGLGDDLERAEELADAFVYAQENDRYFDDGRIRNAYQAGDLVLPPGWTPNGRVGTARMPGWWNENAEKWVEDPGQVGTSTGNVAWVMLAMLRAHQVLGHPEYLDAVVAMAEWVESETADPEAPGYFGGFDGWTDGQTRYTWKSTEHNLDLYVGFMTLYDLTGDPVWQERALDAKQFVRAMWEACEPGHFATGTHPEGYDTLPNCDFQPVDVNTWGLMALGEVERYGAGTRWSVLNARVVEPCFDGEDALGLDFDDDRDGIWWEGTAHTAIALDILGLGAGWNRLTVELTDAQALAPRTDGKGIVATCHDGVSTGIDGFLFYNRLHTAATAWYAMAIGHHNPIWGIGTDEPIPHEGE